MRKSSEALLWGSYKEYFRSNRKLYLYERRLNGECILILCSFSAQEQKYRLPKGFAEQAAELLLCNYPKKGSASVLRPYEVRVFRWKDAKNAPNQTGH